MCINMQLDMAKHMFDPIKHQSERLASQNHPKLPTEI